MIPVDDRWNRLQEVFERASGLSGPSRTAYLDQTCAADPEFRAEIEDLLRSDGESASIVQRAVQGTAAEIAEPAQPQGRMVGAYRILGEIGRGGMGAVYLAERADAQFHKRVAIKMARYAGEDAFLLERFRHERQILAALEHPNIARLLDGGETEDGMPFLVMEYIEGVPLMKYIEDRRLDIRARLDLFLKAAAAVQYAHRLLVIHRDLKPSNILVTESGEPKLLDFGIAKLVEPGLVQGAIMHTSTGVRLLTPDYASPEQVRGMPVSTSSDVYSLGAILFEVLTGQRAHRIKEYTAIEIDRAVCETETARPGSVNPALDAEIDIIVLTAMQKEPARRYASVDHLADDIRRYVDGLPILARADSTTYRVGKFVRRHRLGVGAAALLALSLVGGIAATAWQARQARAAADRAELRFKQVRQLANRFLFDFETEVRKLPGSTPAREMIVKTAQQYLDSLAAESANDPELRYELAMAYQKLGDVLGSPRAPSLGHSEQARAAYGRSLSLARQLHREGERRHDLIDALVTSTRMATLLDVRMNAKPDHASNVRMLEEAAADVEEVLRGARTPQMLRALGSLYREIAESHSRQVTEGDSVAANIDHGINRTRQAAAVFEELYQLEPVARNQAGRANASVVLADFLMLRGDLEETRANYQRALELRLAAAKDPEVSAINLRAAMLAYMSLGNVLGDPLLPNLGRRDEALAATMKARDMVRTASLTDPADRTAQLDWAEAEGMASRILLESEPARALVHVRQAVTLIDGILRGAPRDRVYLRRWLRHRHELGMALRATGDPAGARRQFEAVIQRVEGPDPFPVYQRFSASSKRELALTVRSRDLALEALRQAEEHYLPRLESLDALNHLSSFYETAGELAGREYYEKARRLWEEWPKHGRSSGFDVGRLARIQAKLRATARP
ncbi:MAG: hypothetical protein FJW39_30880 [Acidobacteria bacterium]|nr:hypothetical protein [Acidobacteriota bacterium]